MVADVLNKYREIHKTGEHKLVCVQQIISGFNLYWIIQYQILSLTVVFLLHSFQGFNCRSTTHTQFKYPHLVQLSIPSSNIHTQFNYPYLVQLSIHSSTIHTQFNNLYLVQLSIPSSTIHTQFNYQYLVQLSIPSSTIHTQFNQIYRFTKSQL